MHPINKIPQEAVQIRGWSDMEKIGISLLTGERDGTQTRRMLCDLSETGAKIMCHYLDLRLVNGAPPLNSNWNQYVGNEKAVYSIMLQADWWMDIAVFALIVTGAKYIYRSADVVWTDEGEDWEKIESAWANAYAKEGAEPVYANVLNHVPTYMRGVSKWRGNSFNAINNPHLMSGRK